MVAATDTAGGLLTLRTRFKIPNDRQITSMFRVGKVAAGALSHRQRLPVRDLLV
jgi:hypothetical protein